MDDETRPRRPDVSGNRRSQHRRDNQIGIEPADPVPHHLIPQREFDRHLVAAIGKLDVYPLGHAVVATRNEQDPHVPLPVFGRLPLSQTGEICRSCHSDVNTRLVLAWR